ncbi:MAG: NF038130 family PEP-CTERM protein [Microcoleaceae cyanobacterium]
MTGMIQKLFIGASVAVGVGTMATAPALANGFSVSGSDYYLYDVDGSETYLNPNAELNQVLQGNSSNPGGNIELFASSESNPNAFYAAPVSITGEVGGQNLTLSSLNAVDWFGASMDMSYGANNLANRWFGEFWNSAISHVSSQGFIGSAAAGMLASNAQDGYAAFLGAGGFQASSDPNISYVGVDGEDINVGLAGHLNLGNVYGDMLAGLLPANYAWASPYVPMLMDGFQASEVVKYSYNGVTDYLFGFEATDSNLTERSDGTSHNGNYEVTIAGVVEPAAVPEPSTILGLTAVSGLLAATRRKARKA